MNYLAQPDWKSVRPIYKKLSDEFHVLTDAYNVQIAERQKLMLDHLILGIDVVDQSIDELPTKEERDNLTNSILAFLTNKEAEWHHPLASDLLTEKIIVLKLIVQELNIAPRFSGAVSNIFAFTEQKRHSLNAEELIDLVKKEGAATAELPLSVMNVAPDTAFAAFFRSLCMLMGIADLIADARSDYRSNYIALKPVLGLYLKLIGLLIKEGLSLIWKFPQKFAFFSYCLRFGILLFTTKD